MYTEWFNKDFLRYAPKERPLLLLQDGASAHLGIELIDAAIANNVILLCFPPKLTHILQPCDVGIYRAMKANISNSMQHIRMLRSELWLNKGKIPAILREVFEKTFTPSLIISSFKKCGIAPLCEDAIGVELVKKSPSVEREAGEANQQDEGTVIAELTLDVVSPSQVPADVEVLTADACDVCPPRLALEAIQNSLTPKKFAAYKRRESNGDIGEKDPVYATWVYLKHQLEGNPQLLAVDDTLREDHPLLKAGLIPKRLVDVFKMPPEKGTHMRRSATTKTRVLTCEELSNEIRERDQKRKLAQSEKEQKKIIRLEKRAKKEMEKQRRQTKRRTRTRKRMPSSKPVEVAATSISTPTTLSASTATSTSLPTTSPVATATSTPTATADRQAYFADLQTTLSNCRSYDAMRLAIPGNVPYSLEARFPPQITDLENDHISQTLLTHINNVATSSLRTVRVEADGNRLRGQSSSCSCTTNCT